MIKTIFSIRDQKTSEFLHPFIEINDETAQREFYNTLSQVPTMSQHPTDFDLYEIGTFDTETGAINAENINQFKINGLDCIKIIQKQQAETNETIQESHDSSIQPSTKG